jgi:putative salt-induced outer membrane protein YdiY
MVAVEAGGLLAPQNLALADLTAANPPEKPKIKWTGHLTFGATKTTGNSRSTSASGDADLERRTEDDRILVTGYYLYAQAQDPSTNVTSTTTDKWYVEVAYDYFVSKQWFVLADVNYMKNRIANLDGRAIGTLGMGYQWIESKKMNFNTNASVGGMHESYTHPDRNDDTIVGQISWHFDRALTDSLTFLHDFRINPDLGEPIHNFKLETSAELRAALYKAIFASFKVLIDYDSMPAAGQERTDTAYILGVGINF